MHFNKLGSSDNNMNLLTSSSSTSLFTASATSSSSTSSLPSSSATKTRNTTTTLGLNLGLWWLLFVAVILMAQQQPCECRYLPTRSYNDNLAKLRELLLQILASSNEDIEVQQRPTNEASGNTLTATSPRLNWITKLAGNMDTMDSPRKYNAARGMYDSARCY